MKNHCLRYLAPSDPDAQWYLKEPPYKLDKDKGFECDHFVNVSKKDEE